MAAARLQKRGYSVVSGGTDNHLFLLDLSDKAITGKEADAALGKAHITVNKNAVPNDPRPPIVTSGLRIGSPAGTTRGFKEREFEQIADLDRRRARCQRQRRGHRERVRGKRASCAAAIRSMDPEWRSSQHEGVPCTVPSARTTTPR